MKWILLILLALTVAAFLWSGHIYVTGRVADEKLGAMIPFAVGCVLGLVFFVLLIAKAIFS
jgi:hypothetical protein